MMLGARRIRREPLADDHRIREEAKAEESRRQAENQRQIDWVYSAFGAADHRDELDALAREHCALVAFARVRELKRTKLDIRTLPAGKAQAIQALRGRAITTILAAGEALIAAEETPPLDMRSRRALVERAHPATEIYWEPAVRHSLDALARHGWLDHLTEHAIHYARPWSHQRFTQVASETSEIIHRLAKGIEKLAARADVQVMENPPRTALPLVYSDAREISANLHRIHAHKLLWGKYPPGFDNPMTRSQYLAFVYPSLSDPPATADLLAEAARQCCDYGLQPWHEIDSDPLLYRFDLLKRAAILRSVPESALRPESLLRAMGTGFPGHSLGDNALEHGERILRDMLNPEILGNYRQLVDNASDPLPASCVRASNACLDRLFVNLRNELPSSILTTAITKNTQWPDPNTRPAEVPGGPVPLQ